MATIRDLHRLRSYQLRSLMAKQAGIKRFAERWHRRAGKDRTWATIAFLSGMERKGVYYHFLPTLGAAKRDVWDNIIIDNYDGIEHSYRMIDVVFPPEFRLGKPNETEMQIQFGPGSVYQLMGAENLEVINRARGSNPVGIIFSEYAFMDVDPWPILMPVLMENGGWASFISTPNVEDDNFDKLIRNAQNDPLWFTQTLTVEDTRRDAVGEHGGYVIEPNEIAQLRRENIREEEIQREFYCNAQGYMRGTIYGDVITAAENAGRIGRFPWIPQLPVGVCIDLGHSDAMAVWFYQTRDNGRYFIDYWEDTLKDIKDVAHLLRERKKYLYGRIELPWDGRSAANYLELAGFSNIEVAERNKMRSSGNAIVSIQAQLDAARVMFNTFYFDDTITVKDREGAGAGLAHLKRYQRKWDAEKNAFTGDPIHDEHSHAADALRTGVQMGMEPLVFPFDQWRGAQEIKVETAFDLEKI